MDCTKNGLTLVRELLQEPNNVPSALSVQSGCRFIQEQQKLRFGSEFDTDRETLAGLDVQGYDDRVGQGLKLQELDDLLDVCILLLLRDVVWLP